MAARDINGAHCDPAVIDCYAVMGNPVAHSKSPLIHRLFAEQTGQKLCYEALLVAPDGFAQAVADFRTKGGKGLNITVPFKREAWRMVDELSDRARRAGAVNVMLMRDNGLLYGDNTDGIGLVRDLTRNLGIALRGKRLLLLGAGGAARGILGPLLEQKPSSVSIANRTSERAMELADAFARLGNLHASGLNDIVRQHYDLIINATAASLQNKVPAIPADLIDADSCCYDLMYNATEPTAFVRYAIEHGCPCAHDGLGMLVEQACESFRLWRGITPDTAPVIARLRKA